VSNIPDDLVYTRDHEWARVDGDRARVGITDHAQSELTDVVYVELPAIGRVVARGDPIGVVESVKAVSEILAPVAGTIVESNRRLEDHPELVNKDPYGEGWMVVLEVSSPGDITALMDAAAYRRHVGE
jgi:glycine cleavage system H protein